MHHALTAGLLVGLSVAVFVGGAAMVVMETAIARGPAFALAAGGGIATGDALWATLAAGAGAALGRLLAPAATALQWSGLAALVWLLVLAVRELLRPEPPASVVGLSLSPLSAYGEFLAHALRHSTTVVFFAGIIIGAAPRYSAEEAAAFVAGVFLASLTWQWFLVAAGTWRRRPFSGRARRGVLALDCVLLAMFIAEIARGL